MSREFTVLLVMILTCVSVRAADPAPQLHDDDKNLLSGLLKEFLFDPKGCDRVQVEVVRRSAWGESEKTVRTGWLVAGKDGRPDRVAFADGESVPAPVKMPPKKIDFIAECKRRYAEKKPEEGDDPRDRFGQMRLTALGLAEESDLALAAWLHRLGEDGLAATALAAARKPEGDPVKRLRQDLAWTAFAGMVHAYIVRADDEALAHGERLLRMYAAEAKGKEFGQAEAVVAELKRRRKAGTFGKQPAEKWPDDFDKWEVKKKVAFLIESLDEVDARQMGQPGGVDLASDRRVQALIAVGDEAVPALIDAVEKDERLTRSVHFWRDFARSRTVLGVREAALVAVMSILRVRVFEPAATGDNFTGRGEDVARQTAERLRAYWKTYGGMPFDERMMAVLTDPKARVEAWREAAENLARLGEERTLGTTVFVDGGGERPPYKPNPAVAKFRKPTAAEAIVAAMDRDLQAHDAGPRDGLHDYHRRHIEDVYLFSLIDLGDKQAAAVCAGRSKAAKATRMRRKWAYAAHWLGDTKPLREYADDFRDGKVPLPPNDRPQTNDDDQPGTVELRGIVDYLAHARTAEADAALNAVADPKHPAHALAAREVLMRSPEWSDNRAWFLHPFCLSLLRRALDDTTPTGTTLKVEENQLKRVQKDGWGSSGLPPELKDPAVRVNEAPERKCDLAAEKIHQLVIGLPRYHALFKDADVRLKSLRETMDRFQGRFRRATGAELEALGLSSWNATFVPDLKPLDRAATAEDVKSGRAVFHFDGKGRPAGVKLPAVAVPKGHEKEEDPPTMLVLQAEVGPDGETTYGVLSRQGLSTVSGKEVGRVTPLTQPKVP